MKHLFTFLFLFTFLGLGISQSGIHYQAVIRDAGGSILNNVPVTVDVTINPKSGSSYFETINTETNDYGIINITIGENGNFALQDLNWEFGDVTMDLEITAGSNSIVISDQPIQNVPYAYFSNYAQKAIDDEVEDADADPGNELQQLSRSGNMITLSNGGGTVEDMTEDADADPSNEIQTLGFDANTRELSLSDGNAVIIPDDVNDDDADPSNELQELDFDANTRDLSLSNGNAVNIPDAVNDADADPGNELQQLSRSGNMITLSNGGGTVEDMTEDADADPSNEIQNLSYDPSSQALIISNGNQVSMSPFVSKWEDSPEGIYSSEPAFIGTPQDSPVLKLENDKISFDVKGFVLPTSSWQPGGIVFRGTGTYGPETVIADHSITWNGLVPGFPSGYPATHKIDEEGFTSFDTIFNNKSKLAPGYVEVNRNSVSNNEYSRLSIFNLTMRDGDNLGVLKSDNLRLGTQANKKVELDASEHGSIKLTNSNNLLISEILTHATGGSFSISDDTGVRTSNITESGLSILSGSGYSTMGSSGMVFGRNTNINASMGVNNNGGYLRLFGENNFRNVVLSSFPNFSNNGFVGVYDENGSLRASIYVDGQGTGRLSADVKPFRMAHPDQPGKSIWYVCVEGPEAAAYDRGTAKLVNGKAKITFSDHFQIVANPETMTVMITPHSADTYGLAVVEKTKDGFIVQEFKGGTGNFTFDWEVKCKRKGYENWKVIQEDKDNFPSALNE